MGSNTQRQIAMPKSGASVKTVNDFRLRKLEKRVGAIFSSLVSNSEVTTQNMKRQLAVQININKDVNTALSVVVSHFENVISQYNTNVTEEVNRINMAYVTDSIVTPLNNIQ